MFIDYVVRSYISAHIQMHVDGYIVGSIQWQCNRNMGSQLVEIYRSMHVYRHGHVHHFYIDEFTVLISLSRRLCTHADVKPSARKRQLETLILWWLNTSTYLPYTVHGCIILIHLCALCIGDEETGRNDDDKHTNRFTYMSPLACKRNSAHAYTTSLRHNYRAETWEQACTCQVDGC
jgi:hypothetical protein